MVLLHPTLELFIEWVGTIECKAWVGTLQQPPDVHLPRSGKALVCFSWSAVDNVYPAFREPSQKFAIAVRTVARSPKNVLIG